MTGSPLDAEERGRLVSYAQNLLNERLLEMSRVVFGVGCLRTPIWRPGFEFQVWKLVSDPPAHVGVDEATLWRHLKGAAEELRQLARDAGGWFTWSRALGKLVFVTEPDWRDLFAKFKADPAWLR